MRIASRTIAIFLGGLGIASVCPAAVTLNYTNRTATPTVTTLTAGSTFSVDVVLRIDNTTTPTTGGVTGLSYRINAATTVMGDPVSPNNVFQLTARKFGPAGAGDTTPASSFPEFNDALTNKLPRFLAPGDPDDLGGVETDTSTALVANGTYQAARLTFLVASNAVSDSYALGFSQIFAQTNYAGPDPNNTATAFNGFGTYTVNVVTPEPVCGALAAAIGIATLRRRRA